MKKRVKRPSVPVFDDPEPENDCNPLFLRINTKMEEIYKDLQCLPKFLSFSKVKQKLT